MRLTRQSRENLKVADRVGFDQTDAGVLVYVERNSNRAYLHTADGPACYPSIAEARAIIQRHRPDLAERPRRSVGPAPGL